MNSVRRLNEAPPAGPHAVASAAAAAAAAGATGGGDDLTDKMTIYEGVITVLNREVEKLSTQVTATLSYRACHSTCSHSAIGLLLTGCM